MDSKKIGNFIAQCRKEKNLTQEKLANELLTVRETISKWERGIYIPSNEMLLKLGQLFNVSVNEILCGERANQYDKVNYISGNQVINSKKRLQKALIFMTITIVLLIILIYIYYFVNSTYFSIYKIYGNDDVISLNYGIMIVSNKKSYIQLGDIKNLSNYDVVKIRLYYIYNNEEFDIFSNSKNDYDYNKLFKYDDLINTKNDLYLEFEFINNTTHVLKLIYEKEFLDTVSVED